MMDIIQAIKNQVLLIGLEKTEKSIDGASLTKELIAQIDDFTKDTHKTNQIVMGPLRSLLEEMYEGLYEKDRNLLIPGLMTWIVKIRGKDGGWAKLNATAKSNIVPKNR